MPNGSAVSRPSKTERRRLSPSSRGPLRAPALSTIQQETLKIQLVELKARLGTYSPSWLTQHHRPAGAWKHKFDTRITKPADIGTWGWGSSALNTCPASSDMINDSVCNFLLMRAPPNCHVRRVRIHCDLSPQAMLCHRLESAAN